jgi:hypothetical protein
MSRARLIAYWVTATVTLMALAPFIYVLVQSVVNTDGFHDGDL